MTDRDDVVVQKQPYRQRVDLVVRFDRPLLQYSRELANSRQRHISQMSIDRILHATVRRADGRCLGEEAFDFCESVGRARRNAQRVSGQKVSKNPCSILAVSNS